MTDRYAVIGNPVAHSRSPDIHSAFARETGQAIEYGRVLAPLDGFEATVQAFRAQGGKGANVTLPFKEEAFRLSSARTRRAEQAGAVNTLRFDGDEVSGDNTDGVGLVRDLRDNLGVALAGARVLVIGAGGAGRGVLGPLADEGPGRLVIVNRTHARAVELAARFHIEAVELGALAGASFDLVINATSASLGGGEFPLPARLFGVGSFGYDMMYGKGETSFLAGARAQGAATADGLGMLVEQAGESFLFWRGVRPATRPVLEAIRKTLAP